MNRIFFFGGLLVAMFLGASPVAAATQSPLVITEVQTAGLSYSYRTDEFIEIYNQSDVAVDLSAWKIEYVTASGSVVPVMKEGSMKGLLGPRAFLLLARQDYALPDARFVFGVGLSEKGGSIRISAGADQDSVGWGEASVREGVAADGPGYTQSLKRKVDSDIARFVDTGNSAADFEVAVSPSPYSSILLADVQGGGCSADMATASDACHAAASVQQAPGLCLNAVVTEVMANPSGGDAEAASEFVELYNPTQTVIDMDGCTLKTSASSKKFAFSSGTEIAPGEHRAFKYQETGLTLINSGGEVMVMSEDTEAVYEYPLLGDDQAWALINESWGLTDIATPGAANRLVQLAEAEDSKTQAACPASKYRNPDTGRCKTAETEAAADTLASCKPGQVRNPETNRCRSTVAAAAVLAPCQTGYERNPSTNRCRKVVSADSELKPCDPGQERNPATNRCRKTAAAVPPLAAAATNPQSSIGGTTLNGMQWWGLGIIGAGAAAYGLYEWRYELAKGGRKILRFLPFIGPGR